jgi:serine/threonine-protein phosphatase 5
MTSISEEQKAKAEAIKNEANVHFKGKLILINNKRLANLDIEKHFNAAIEKYSEAIEINPNVASYYTNRAFCHIKLESYGYAIT